MRIKLVILTCCLALCSSSFAADIDVKACVKSADTTQRSELRRLKSDYKNAKLACRSGDPVCGQNCVNARKTCMAPLITAYTAAEKACLDTYAAAVTSCKAQVNCGPGTAAGNCGVNSLFQDCLRPHRITRNGCMSALVLPEKSSAGIACYQGQKACFVSCRSAATP